MNPPKTPSTNPPQGAPHPLVSLSIHAEIHRFESVHPSIYSIYELIEHLKDENLANLIREHVVCIEDSFVNSQEWTLARSVQTINIGLLGDVNSSKSTLVHRYLTGQYVEDNSPEGGRFKKEVVLNGRPHLLLIRDEGGPPELQFSQWIDVLILVANSIPTVSHCYSLISRLANYKSLTSLPIILASAGNDASFCESFKKIPHCLYINTDVVSGHNVERLFNEACNLVLNQPSASSSSSGGGVKSNAIHSNSNNNNNNNNNSTSSSRKLFTTPRKSMLIHESREIPLKQGHLLKKSLKKWKKKYVILIDYKLFYFDSINNYMENKNKKSIDLKHCNVKGGGGVGEKGYSFSLTTVAKVYEFEVPSGGGIEERDEWIRLIEGAILGGLQGGENSIHNNQIVELEGNESCADCGGTSGVDWVSINLGVVVCISCSGIHRSIGCHISKVRCLKLDELSPWIVDIMTLLGGNKRLNGIYEANLGGSSSKKPNPGSSNEEKTEFVKRKYEKLEWIEKRGVSKEGLLESVSRGDFWSVFLLLLNAPRGLVLNALEDLVRANTMGASLLQILLWATEGELDERKKDKLKELQLNMDETCRNLVKNL